MVLVVIIDLDRLLLILFVTTGAIFLCMRDEQSLYIQQPKQTNTRFIPVDAIVYDIYFLFGSMKRDRDDESEH